MPKVVQVGNYWEAETEDYIAAVEERRQPPRSLGTVDRILEGATRHLLNGMWYFVLLALVFLPLSFSTLPGGFVFGAVLLLWFMALEAAVLVVFHAMMVGHPPTWKQIVLRWRMLHRLVYRW